MSKVTKDMLDLAKHIVNQKSGNFEPEKFEDHYENRIDRSHQPEAKRAGRSSRRSAPRGENVVDLMEALRQSVGGAVAAETKAPKEVG